MAFTRILGPGIHTESDLNIRNLEVTGNLSVGGTVTTEDVTNIDSVGVITARAGIQGIGIQSGGVNVAVGVLTALNFIGAGNTFKVSGTTVDISIQGGGLGAGSSAVGINTDDVGDLDVVGVGNSFQGLYISNGLMIMDNTLFGNHYIGTAFNGLMAGPVDVQGILSVDGNYVVV